MRFKKQILFAVFCVATMSCTTISPREMTMTSITETFVRISIYAQTNRAIAPSLDVLPKRDGYGNRTVDGWGRPLKYRVSPDGMITLTSLGRDGKQGGTGEDADLSKSYFAQKPDGSLWVGSDMWIMEAEVR